MVLFCFALLLAERARPYLITHDSNDSTDYINAVYVDVSFLNTQFSSLTNYLRFISYILGPIFTTIYNIDIFGLVGLPTHECLHCYSVAIEKHSQRHLATGLRL